MLVRAFLKLQKKVYRRMCYDLLILLEQYFFGNPAKT